MCAPCVRETKGEIGMSKTLNMGKHCFNPIYSGILNNSPICHSIVELSSSFLKMVFQHTFYFVHSVDMGFFFLVARGTHHHFYHNFSCLLYSRLYRDDSYSAAVFPFPPSPYFRFNKHMIYLIRVRVYLFVHRNGNGFCCILNMFRIKVISPNCHVCIILFGNQPLLRII